MSLQKDKFDALAAVQAEMDRAMAQAHEAIAEKIGPVDSSAASKASFVPRPPGVGLGAENIVANDIQGEKSIFSTRTSLLRKLSLAKNGSKSAKLENIDNINHRSSVQNRSTGKINGTMNGKFSDWRDDKDDDSDEVLRKGESNKRPRPTTFLDSFRQQKRLNKKKKRRRTDE